MEFPSMKARKLVPLTLAQGGEAEHGHVSDLMTSDAGRAVLI